jgi:cation diffusion facilitator CzcD-associated flavoprotein CzcO
VTGTPGHQRVRVAIVGSGFSGLGMAAALLRHGIDDFVVLEKADDVGGTWRDNTYPGAACDVPSLLYSYSYVPNPGWSRSFSPQGEILDYLRCFAAGQGILPHIRFGHGVTRARWDDESSGWVIETTAGTIVADVLVSARGPLSEPKLPSIPGIERFTGTMFHSARWNHEHDLTGERVAVIGTGASAIQFVPRIQPEVGRLSVFQRTPPWIIPRRDRTLGRLEHRVFRAVPPVQQSVRAAIYWGRELYVLGFVGTERRRRRMMGAAELVARRHLANQVPDPGLRDRLTPHYDMGCKRILISNDYYPALSQPNVDVVTDPIVEVTEHSVVTADGTEHPVDTVIFGTGFDVTNPETARTTIGRGGVSLADAWSTGLAAHRGTTVAGFPNLFIMVGPNTGLGHTSIVFVIESQIAYVLGALDAMSRDGIAALDPRREAQDQWNRRLAERSRRTVWTAGGCDSYYLDDRGHNVAVWPGSSWGLRRSLRRFDIESYRTVVGADDRPAGRAMLVG